jgi:hypothetical protein
MFVRSAWTEGSHNRSAPSLPQAAAWTAQLTERRIMPVAKVSLSQPNLDRLVQDNPDVLEASLHVPAGQQPACRRLPSRSMDIRHDLLELAYSPSPDLADAFR